MVPDHLLDPSILVFCAIGAFRLNNSGSTRRRG
jgi:hypothetical protein